MGDYFNLFCVPDAITKISFDLLFQLQEFGLPFVIESVKDPFTVVLSKILCILVLCPSGLSGCLGAYEVQPSLSSANVCFRLHLLSWVLWSSSVWLLCML